ncbi:MAG: MarR family transcriptional regulator [Thermomicrobiales bacterium]
MNAQRSERQQRIDTWLAFLRVHSRVTATLESELEAAESLSMSWFDVLEQLQQAPERQLRMQELGEMLAMSTSGLSRRVSRMEQAGLVERRPCPDDRRGVLVVLTRTGARRYRKALPVHLRGVERYFLDNLDRADSETMEMAFNRILEAIDDLDKNGG